jgi:hypothetical protein
MDIAKEKLHDIRVQLDKYPVLQDLEVSKRDRIESVSQSLMDKRVRDN